MEIRYAASPEDFKNYDTKKIRENFLKEEIFEKNKNNFVYSHVDRIIFWGIMPVGEILSIENWIHVFAKLWVNYFLERRELGIINVWWKGIIIVDWEEVELDSKDGLYLWKWIKDVKFKSVDLNNPAKFYISSAPAHKTFPMKKININDATPLKLWADETLNKRTIYQYVHPNVCESCQLLMWMTILEKNNVWNTMPCHLHDRRMEVYFYFDIPKDSLVFHYMWEPSETRHLVMKNEQATISPSWSIHSWVWLTNYSFIWSMVWENQNFEDMDAVNINSLK